MPSPTTRRQCPRCCTRNNVWTLTAASTSPASTSTHHLTTSTTSLRVTYLLRRTLQHRQSGSNSTRTTYTTVYPSPCGTGRQAPLGQDAPPRAPWRLLPYQPTFACTFNTNAYARSPSRHPRHRQRLHPTVSGTLTGQPPNQVAQQLQRVPPVPLAQQLLLRVPPVPLAQLLLREPRRHTPRQLHSLRHHANG